MTILVSPMLSMYSVSNDFLHYIKQNWRTNIHAVIGKLSACKQRGITTIPSLLDYEDPTELHPIFEDYNYYDVDLQRTILCKFLLTQFEFQCSPQPGILFTFIIERSCLEQWFGKEEIAIRGRVFFKLWQAWQVYCKHAYNVKLRHAEVPLLKSDKQLVQQWFQTNYKMHRRYYAKDLEECFPRSFSLDVIEMIVDFLHGQ